MLEVHNFTQNEIDEELLKRVAKITLKTVSQAGSSVKLAKGKTEISLAVVGDGRMRKLNKMYRGKNRVTDVLSFDNRSVVPYLSKAFPRLGRKDAGFIEPLDGVKRLGEIVICYPQARKQARRLGNSFSKELTILLIHGILHLLGYDHERDEKEAGRMEEMEKMILEQF